MLVKMSDRSKSKPSALKTDTCPCGNGSYASCCQPYHTGKVYPETAEQLMRSRYSAYSLREVDYIYQTTHSTARHSELKEAITRWAESATFLQLTIKNTKAGKKKDKAGIVEFIATYSEAAVMKQRHEVSLFEKVKKRWYYLGAEE